MSRRRVLLMSSTTTEIAGLIHHFPLSDNGNLYDIIGPGIITSQSNRVTWDTTENKYLFNSNSGIAAIISGLNLGIVNGSAIDNLTIFCRIKPTQYIGSYLIALSNGGIDIATTNIVSNSVAILENSIGSRAYSYYGTGKTSYINGISSGNSAPGIGNATNNGILNIGSTGTNNRAYFFLWDIRIYNRVLTDVEIKNLG